MFFAELAWRVPKLVKDYYVEPLDFRRRRSSFRVSPWHQFGDVVHRPKSY